MHCSKFLSKIYTRKKKHSSKFTSRITLTSPDPSSIQEKRNKRDTVSSQTDTVTYIPHHEDDADQTNKVKDETAFKHERKIGDEL